jgi:chloramphenicol 3-O phosphotransferase
MMVVVQSADSQPGQVVFLNGSSSSGKSSIAWELLEVMPGPYFHLAVDAFNGMRAKRRSRELSPAELTAVLTRTRAGFHRAAAGMARAGNDVVVDHVLSERWRLLDCLQVMDGLDVIFVGVYCAPAELARREQARGDRDPGTAAAQQERVHAHGDYDLRCDTTSTSARDCALAIRNFAARGPAPRAFGRLRSELGTGAAGSPA